MYQTDDRTSLTRVNKDILPKYEVSCRSCGKGIKLYDESQASFVTCTNCQTLINLEENHTDIQIFVPTLTEVPISIGSLCSFKNIPYKVIGYSIFKEKADPKSFWTEYILIDTNGNYKILTNFQNHFNLFDYEPITEDKIKKGKKHKKTLYQIDYAEDTYHLLAKYEPVWQCSFGEIPFDPQNSGMCYEYVYREKIITRQIVGPLDAEEYTYGEYMNRWEMKKAFGQSFEKPSIISGNRVPFKGLDSKMTFVAFLVFVAAASILSIIKDYLLPEEILFQKEYLIEPVSSKDTFIISRSFELKNGPSLLALELNTPGLRNTWLASFVSLVNEETNTQQGFEIYTSFYSGYDGGSSWTEGKTQAFAYVDQVEEGRYHLTFEFEKLNSPNETSALFILSKNPGIWKNFWVLTVIAFIFPLIFWFVERYYIAQKEMNSNTALDFDL